MNKKMFERTVIIIAGLFLALLCGVMFYTATEYGSEKEVEIIEYEDKEDISIKILA